MSQARFESIVESTSRAIDAAGVLVLVGGLLVATVLLVRTGLGGQAGSAYREFRQRVGRSILLGLEFLVAADIIRTVAIEPSFRGAGVLAVIVAIRTFLSFTLEVELEGRWPWQKSRSAPEAGASG